MLSQPELPQRNFNVDDLNLPIPTKEAKIWIDVASIIDFLYKSQPSDRLAAKVRFQDFSLWLRPRVLDTLERVRLCERSRRGPGSRDL